MTGVTCEIMRDQIFKLAVRGMRGDGRAFDEMRTLQIETGVIENAEGSARVRLGDTDVIVGIKVDVGTPFKDRPGDGILMTGAELRPLAHAEFETGPPREEAIELARVVDRGIRESGMIDLQKLCITTGEQVFMVFVDIQPLDHYGNLFDASNIAAVAALRTATVPATRFEQPADFPMPVNALPISTTFAKLGRHVFVDPELKEEEVADARLTIVTDENGNIRAMQKGLCGSFTFAEVKECISLAQRHGARVRERMG